MAIRGWVGAAVLLAAAWVAPARAGDRGAFRPRFDVLALLLADQSVTLDAARHSAVRAPVPAQTLFASQPVALSRVDAWAPAAAPIDMNDFDRLSVAGVLAGGAEFPALRAEAAWHSEAAQDASEFDPEQPATGMNRWIAVERLRTYPVVPRYRPQDPLATMLVVHVRSGAAPIVGIEGPGIAGALWSLLPRP